VGSDATCLSGESQVWAETNTRRRLPSSAAWSANVAPVAPGMSVHTSPAAVLRCHRRAVAVPLPVQVPAVAVSVAPMVAAPVMDGATVVRGSLSSSAVSVPAAAVIQPDRVPA
jgi:hypothetical protein